MLLYKIGKFALSPNALTDFKAQKNDKLKFAPLILLALPLAIPVYVGQMAQKAHAEVRAEIAQEEKERHITLAEERTLAGIAQCQKAHN